MTIRHLGKIGPSIHTSSGTHAGTDLRLVGLNVAFGDTDVVRDVNLHIPAGTSYGLVGESGSGKSMTCRAIMGILPPGGKSRGQMLLADRDLLTLDPRQMRAVRGTEVAMVFQDPMSSLNPLLRVGRAIAQVIQAHNKISARTARREAVVLMNKVGIRDAEARAKDYPHQFSGGMRQRIVMAMALACKPALMLADEPTTALDVLVQAGVLRLLDDLRTQEHMSLLMVSHDLAVVAGLCDRIGIMYAGELVEEGRVDEVLTNPRHPYTRALLASMPETSSSSGSILHTIAGSPPDPGCLPPGCPFAPRCLHATQVCRESDVPLLSVSQGHLVRCIHEPGLPPFSLEAGNV